MHKYKDRTNMSMDATQLCESNRTHSFWILTSFCWVSFIFFFFSLNAQQVEAFKFFRVLHPSLEAQSD